MGRLGDDPILLSRTVLIFMLDESNPSIGLGQYWRPVSTEGIYHNDLVGPVKTAYGIRDMRFFIKGRYDS